MTEDGLDATLCHKATLVSDCDKFVSNSHFLTFIPLQILQQTIEKIVSSPNIVMKLTKNRHRMALLMK